MPTKKPKAVENIVAKRDWSTPKKIMSAVQAKCIELRNIRAAIEEMRAYASSTADDWDRLEGMLDEELDKLTDTINDLGDYDTTPN